MCVCVCVCLMCRGVIYCQVISILKVTILFIWELSIENSVCVCVQELQAMFSETSALSGDNVLQAHSTLAQLLLAREDADLKELKKRSLAARREQKSKCSC